MTVVPVAFRRGRNNTRRDREIPSCLRVSFDEGRPPAYDTTRRTIADVGYDVIKYPPREAARGVCEAPS